MSQAILIPLIVIGFCIIFPLFWCLIVGMTAFLGGWRKLASDYPGQPEQNAEWKYMCTASLGGFLGLGHYKSTLNIGKDESYLHLKPMFLFAAFHPKISVPLVDISAEIKGSSLLTLTRLSFFHSKIPLKVSGKVATWVMDWTP